MADGLCLRKVPSLFCSNKQQRHSDSPWSSWRADRVAQHPCARASVKSLKAASDLNPQNVPDPKVMPSPELSAEEAVRVQLEALRQNDEPWFNHGIQTAYEFGEDIGGMERSRYFGYSKDLYHFDHFLGQFQNAFPVFVNADDFNIGTVEKRTEDDYGIVVEVRKGSVTSKACFHLLRKGIGRKKGSLMTKSIELLSE